MRESVAVLVGMDKTEKSRLKKARVSISRHRTVPLAIGMEQCFWPLRLSRKSFCRSRFCPQRPCSPSLPMNSPCSWPTLCFNQSLIAVLSATFRIRNILDSVTHRRAQRNISSPYPAQHFGRNISVRTAPQI
jgi:hypothetical protein